MEPFDALIQTLRSLKTKSENDADDYRRKMEIAMTRAFAFGESIDRAQIAMSEYEKSFENSTDES